MFEIVRDDVCEAKVKVQSNCSGRKSVCSGTLACGNALLAVVSIGRRSDRQCQVLQRPRGEREGVGIQAGKKEEDHSVGLQLPTSNCSSNTSHEESKLSRRMGILAQSSL